MKIIDINQIKEVKVLRKGELSIPRLDFASNPDLNLNSTTLLAAYSVISSRVESMFFDGLDWDENGDIHWQNAKLKKLAREITDLINGFSNNPSDENLIRIFLLIQLWGGNAGRTIFVRGKGWRRNFDIDCYRKSIEFIQKGNYLDALSVMNTMYGINTAFSTKHIHFWSLSAAPIFDSIIAEIVFGDTVKEKDYKRYLDALDAMIKESAYKGVTRSNIERNLFNWASTAAGLEWRAIRKSNREKITKSKH
jgi:hypothetical protein